MTAVVRSATLAFRSVTLSVRPAKTLSSIRKSRWGRGTFGTRILLLFTLAGLLARLVSRVLGFVERVGVVNCKLEVILAELDEDEVDVIVDVD